MAEHTIDQFGQTVQLQLLLDKKARLYADYLAACGQCARRDRAHQTDPRAAVDQCMAVLANPCAKLAHGGFEGRLTALVCTQIYGYVHNFVLHYTGVCRAIGGNAGNFDL